MLPKCVAGATLLNFLVTCTKTVFHDCISYGTPKLKNSFCEPFAKKHEGTLHLIAFQLSALSGSFSAVKAMDQNWALDWFLNNTPQNNRHKPLHMENEIAHNRTAALEFKTWSITTKGADRVPCECPRWQPLWNYLKPRDTWSLNWG